MVFSGGDSGDSRAEGGVWRGGSGSHHGPADLWRLPDGIKRGGIERLFIAAHLSYLLNGSEANVYFCFSFNN